MTGGEYDFRGGREIGTTTLDHGFTGLAGTTRAVRGLA